MGDYARRRTDVLAIGVGRLAETENTQTLKTYSRGVLAFRNGGTASYAVISCTLVF